MKEKKSSGTIQKVPKNGREPSRGFLKPVATLASLGSNGPAKLCSVVGGRWLNNCSEHFKKRKNNCSERYRAFATLRRRPIPIVSQTSSPSERRSAADSHKWLRICTLVVVFFSTTRSTPTKIWGAGLLGSVVCRLRSVGALCTGKVTMRLDRSSRAPR